MLRLSVLLTAAALAGCSLTQNTIVGDVCAASDAELEDAGFSTRSATPAPKVEGQGAGRGRQGVTITCPDGRVIVVRQDVEGQGGGQGTVSP